jgi:C-terminal processing protease CtpA/Prc
MRKQDQPGVRARRYRRLQLQRGLLLALAVSFCCAAVSSVFFFRPRAEVITGSDWAKTRAFSGKYSAEELRDTYKASHAAYKLYIKRDQLIIDHSRIDKSFDQVRSEAELVQVISELITIAEDPYAQVFRQNEADHIFAVQGGKQVGVELRFNFDWQSNRWKVAHCPPESSAARAGIIVGDELLSIGSRSVHTFGAGWQAGQGIEAALANGLLGSTVEVVVRRGEDFITAEVERVIVGAYPSLASGIPWNPLQSGQLNNARVIQIVTLYHPDIVKSFHDELISANRAGQQGIVLNMTEGFGGDPEAALRIAAMLMEKGVISNRITVTEQGELLMRVWEVKDGKVWEHTKGPFALAADGSLDTKPKEADKSVALDWPCGVFKGQVIVSVSNWTRGAGEVIVGALKGNDSTRFVLVGSEWTGGRGTGQTYIPVGADYVLRLSTSFTLLPDGKPIEGKGLMPDVGVDPNMDPTQAATVILARRLQVVPAPIGPPQPESEKAPVEAPKK